MTGDTVWGYYFGREGVKVVFALSDLLTAFTVSLLDRILLESMSKRIALLENKIV